MADRLTKLLWFLLPLSLLWGEYHVELRSVPLYPFEFIIVGLGVITFFHYGWRGYSGALKKIPLLVKVGGVIFLLALIPATFIAADTVSALGVVKSWIIFPLFAALTFLAGEYSAEPLELGIITFSLVQTLVGLVLLDDQSGHRLQGLFASPNFYAASAVPALMLALHRLRSIRVRGFAAGAAILLFFGILLSQSLGGFLGMAGGCAYMVLRMRNTRVRWILVAVCIVIALGGAIIARGRFHNLSGTSLNSREEIWQVAWDLGKQHPVWGIGIKGFHAAYEANVGRVIGVPIEWSVPEPHNLYLGWWLNFGLFGLIGILLIVGGVFAGAGLGAGAALAAVLVHGLVDTPFLKVELALLFWLYCALLLQAKDKNV
jgi:O-antigen ligase